jgi:hypothetical protein
MIAELIVTTQNADGTVHIAPMGVHIQGEKRVILPFRPSTTLTNLLNTPKAVLNYCDDVRIFAGCLTGRRDWSLNGLVLTNALAHSEVEVATFEDDELRPKFICHVINTIQHKPFTGFNRAQFAVLEAAILVSRIAMLPMAKIEQDLAYLKIGFDKTAGEHEQEAWEWLMADIERYKHENLQ